MFGAFAAAFFFILTLLWCKEILGRFPSDLKEFRKTQDFGDKAVILFYWVLTVPIIMVMAMMIWIAIGGLGDFFP